MLQLVRSILFTPRSSDRARCEQSVGRSDCYPGIEIMTEFEPNVEKIPGN